MTVNNTISKLDFILCDSNVYIVMYVYIYYVFIHLFQYIEYLEEIVAITHC